VPGSSSDGQAATLAQALVRLVDQDDCADFKHPQLKQISIDSYSFSIFANADMASYERLRKLCKEQGIEFLGLKDM
jgi:hypothetical protein